MSHYILFSGDLSFESIQIILRILIFPIDNDFNVDMRPGGIAGRANLGDHLPALDLIPYADRKLAVVGIQRAHAVAVVG